MNTNIIEYAQRHNLPRGQVAAAIELLSSTPGARYTRLELAQLIGTQESTLDNIVDWVRHTWQNGAPGVWQTHGRAGRVTYEYGERPDDAVAPRLPRTQQPRLGTGGKSQRPGAAVEGLGPANLTWLPGRRYVIDPDGTLYRIEPVDLS